MICTAHRFVDARVPGIGIFVAEAQSDLEAKGIAEAIRKCPEWSLRDDRVLAASEVGGRLSRLDRDEPVAVVLVGRTEVLDSHTKKWLLEYPKVVIASVPVGDGAITVAFRDGALGPLLAALRILAKSISPGAGERIIRGAEGSIHR